MDEVKKEVQRPLSVSEIFDIAKKSCNVVPYSEMCSIPNIDYLFDRNSLYSIDSEYPFDDNSCIILYLTSDNFGHWCILNRNKERTSYGFLDSYGEMLDDQLKHIDSKYRHDSNQDANYLSKMLYDLVKDDEAKVNYNDVQLQTLNDKIATCGRYVGLFLKHNDLTVEEFANTLSESSSKYGIPIDMLVTMLTISN